MWFQRQKRIEKHAKKIDRFVTVLIIGGAVASIIGLSRKKKTKKPDNETKKTIKILKKGYNPTSVAYLLFGKSLIWVLKIFTFKKKNIGEEKK